MKLTIITPIYNRCNYVSRMYNNILEIKGNIEWIIVDDGSTDNLDEIMDYYINKKEIKIKYMKKKNGGKHTALNYAKKYISGDLVIILDSDDILTADSYITIKESHNKYKDDISISGYVFKKSKFDGTPLTPNFTKDGKDIIDNISYIYNNNIKGDKAEVIKTEQFIKYDFPEFTNENFIGEGTVWIPMGLDYKYVYINKTIYICEYLEGGLTKQGRKLRVSNPKGGIAHAKLFFNHKFKVKYRVKGAILYNVYIRFIPKTERRKYIISNFWIKATYLPSIFLYLKWKKLLKKDIQ